MEVKTDFDITTDIENHTIEVDGNGNLFIKEKGCHDRLMIEADEVEYFIGALQYTVKTWKKAVDATKEGA